MGIQWGWIYDIHCEDIIGLPNPAFFQQTMLHYRMVNPWHHPSPIPSFPTIITIATAKTSSKGMSHGISHWNPVKSPHFSRKILDFPCCFLHRATPAAPPPRRRWRRRNRPRRRRGGGGGRACGIFDDLYIYICICICICIYVCICIYIYM